MFRKNHFGVLLNLLMFVVLCSVNLFAVDRMSFIATEKSSGSFTLSTSGKSAPLCYSSQDYPARGTRRETASR